MTHVPLAKRIWTNTKWSSMAMVLLVGLTGCTAPQASKTHTIKNQTHATRHTVPTNKPTIVHQGQVSIFQPSIHSPTHQHDSVAVEVDNQHDFAQWLNAHGSDSHRTKQVATYQRYLEQQLGRYDVPPMWQLLTTARDWQACQQEQFEVPPRELWTNIVPTLRLYARLKHQGILPESSEIRSTYRNPELNACAGGAANSVHKYYQAIDIWVPEYAGDAARLELMNSALCQYWRYQGKADNFGLGLYSSGAVHIDTAGYRTWGGSHSAGSSYCLNQ